MNAGKNDVLHNLSAFGDAISSGTEALRKAVKAKQNAEILDKLPPKVLKRVDVLKQIQSEQDELKAKYLEERRALEEKYQKLYQPLYTKRCDIVNGVAEVDGVEGVSDELADQVDDKPAEEKGVPSFWLIAMKTNIVLGDWIQKHDEEALKYLKDIKWCRIEVPKDNNKKVEATEGFKLEFFFDTNPFFKNSVLTKTYLIVDEDVPVLERAIGTEIEWFPGKCLTEILKKKPKKGSKNAKPITETETLDSFFNFFTPPELLDDEEEIEDDVLDELESLMEQDYDVGLTIRNRIIPHAVTWFTGEAALYEMSGDLEDEDDDDDDDDDDDEDEDEDEREDNKEEEDEDEAEDDEDDDDDDEDEDEDEDEGEEDDKKTSSQKNVGRG